ncbi:MAG: type II secretion system protein [Epsilonproteobacteria bacterium]|nr:type II secretion system protein [Campylobacterota bacterium]
MYKAKKASFTLLELCIVMALFCFLASLSLQLFLPNSRSIMHTQLGGMQKLFVYLQQKSIASNQDHILFINQANNSFSCSINGTLNTYNLQRQLAFGFIAGSLGPPAKPIKPIEAFTTFKQHENLHMVTFFANGTISVGALYIVDDKKTVMGALTCSVSQVSCVRKYLYTGSSWALI